VLQSFQRSMQALVSPNLFAFVSFKLHLVSPGKEFHRLVIKGLL
jgi:hypothetical protein